MSSQSAIAIHHRQAGDSVDFNARYGRELQAQGAREAMELLRAAFRSWRRRRVARRADWYVEWAAAPQTNHRIRP